MFYKIQLTSSTDLGSPIYNLSKKFYKKDMYYPLNLLYRKPNLIHIFKYITIQKPEAPLALVRRFERLSKLNRYEARYVLEKSISSLVNSFSFNSLYFFIKQLFWLVPVPRHQQLMYLLRAIIKAVDRKATASSGVGFMVRGKIAATGNKRKRVFQHIVGKGAASNLNLQKSSEFRLFRTATGVLGVTSLVTYIR